MAWQDSSSTIKDFLIHNGHFLDPESAIPTYFANFSYDDNSTWFHTSGEQTKPDDDFVYTSYVVAFYRTAVPIMLFFCGLSIIINLVIVASVRWVRRSLKPTLCFSISLAVADAYASLVIGLALLTNSLLTVAYNIHLGLYYNCLALVLEALRMAGMTASVFHLLALAINHYIGILRPLHYASIMTRRNSIFIIVIMWMVPVGFFFVYYSSFERVGFQAPYCYNFNFLAESPYRIVTATIFFVPLVIMTAIYGHIFVIVRQHQQGRLQCQNRNELRRNVKAIITTLLIMGTYLFGWMPAVIFFLISCLDCLYPFTKMPESTVVGLTFTFNTLIIVKSLIDPIIYAARMTEIRDALKRMRRAILCGRGGSRQVDDNMSSVRSRTDTTGSSLRLQSTYGHRDGPSSVLIYQTKELLKENGC